MSDLAITSAFGRELLITACFAFIATAVAIMRSQTAANARTAHRAFRFVGVGAVVGTAALFTALLMGSGS